jgi:hypothetical protein
VERYRRIELAAGDRGIEVDDVRGDDVRVKHQLAGAQEEMLGAEVAPQRVRELAQAVGRALLRALGPEVSHDLLAPEAPVRRAGQQSEQGQRLRLPGGSGAGTALDGRISERAEAQERRTGGCGAAHV